MEQWEFDQLTETTVARFLPRVPAKYARGFEKELHAGEYSMAVENLILTLVNDKVPVTPSEREDLLRLLDHLNLPASKLDNITPVPRP